MIEQANFINYFNTVFKRTSFLSRQRENLKFVCKSSKQMYREVNELRKKLIGILFFYVFHYFIASYSPLFWAHWKINKKIFHSQLREKIVKIKKWKRKEEGLRFAIKLKVSKILHYRIMSSLLDTWKFESFYNLGQFFIQIPLHPQKKTWEGKMFLGAFDSHSSSKNQAVRVFASKKKKRRKE